LPYVVEKDTDACPADKPWAVKTEGSSDVHGCHATKSEAQDQQAALYANTNESAAASVAAQAAALERVHLRNFVSVAAISTQIPDPEVTYDEDGIVLCRISDVPLIEAGMDWPSMTGSVTFGDSHLVGAVEASADPLIPRPRLGLGHTDPRYNPHNCPACDAEIKPDLDGDPNFGFVENMRVEREGTLLSADLVDVPLWLAKVMPVAYPSRSIEGWFAFMGPNKKEYPFVMTRLALLGVHFPAVLALGDLPALYGADTPPFVEIVPEEA
jgi:hypothetical protein